MRQHLIFHRFKSFGLGPEPATGTKIGGRGRSLDIDVSLVRKMLRADARVADIAVACGCCERSLRHFIKRKGLNYMLPLRRRRSA